MADNTVKVTGGEQLSAYLAKVREGIAEWTDEPVYVGYTRKGSHGRLIERGFHPRGGSTFVPGRGILERARAEAVHEAKESVVRSLEQGGPAAMNAKKQLANSTAQRVRSSAPRRSGRLAGSVTIIIGGARRGRR